jgi:hypothetical protein
MGRQRRDDPSLENVFLVIVQTAWQLIVITAVVAVWVYRFMTRQQNNRPLVVSNAQGQAAVADQMAVWLARPQTHRFLIVFGASLMAVFLLVQAIPMSLHSSLPYYAGAFVLGVSGIVLGNAAFHRQQRLTPPASETANQLVESNASYITAYTICLPKDAEWNSQQALHLIEQLISAFPHFIVRLTADATQINWQLLDVTQSAPSVVEPMLRACYPLAEITVTLLEVGLLTQPHFRLVCTFTQVNEFVAPLRLVTDIKHGNNQYDPLAALTHAFNGLRAGERVLLTFALLGVAPNAHKQGEKMVTQSTIHPLQWATWAGIQDALLKKAYRVDRVEKYVYEDQRVFDDKLRQRLYECLLCLQIEALEPQRLGDLAQQVLSEFTHFSWIPYNALDVYETDPQTCIAYVDDEAQARATHSLTHLQHVLERRQPGKRAPRSARVYPLLILDPREIPSLWHLPYQAFSASRIRWSRGYVPLSEAVCGVTQGMRLGMGLHDGKTIQVLQPQADRVTHLNILGRTGMGKSTLMHSLILQDIARGAGVAVIDPHGNLVREVLRSGIPLSRMKDVVLLDFADADYPPPLNPLRSASTYATTTRVMSVMERLYDGFEGAPRMVNYLRSALLLLQADPTATMRDVTRVFLEDAYREKLLSAVDNPELEDFWDMQYHLSSPQMRAQIAEPVLSRIRPFFANPYLYPILCHPDALDFGALLAQDKIILVSLAIDEDTVHQQERDLLGALLITQLQIAAMRQGRHNPYFLYIDEVQRFVTTSLHEVLAEARKYHLTLITANQYLGQLTGKTLEAVMGNVGTTVVFACSPNDAHALSHYMQPEFTAEKLVNLDRFTAGVKLQVDAQTQPAFTLLTDAPLPYPDDWRQREATIRGQSQALYVPKTRAEVLAWLKARYPRQGTQKRDTGGDEDNFYA